jgi:hypothetical protein
LKIFRFSLSFELLGDYSNETERITFLKPSDCSTGTHRKLSLSLFVIFSKSYILEHNPYHLILYPKISNSEAITITNPINPPSTSALIFSKFLKELDFLKRLRIPFKHFKNNNNPNNNKK